MYNEKINLIKELKNDCLHIADMVTDICSSATNAILVIWLFSVGPTAQSISAIITLIIRILIGKFVINNADWAYKKFSLLLTLDGITAAASVLFTFLAGNTPWIYFVYSILMVPIFKLEGVAINRIYKIRYSDPNVRETRDNVRSTLSDIWSLIGYGIGLIFSILKVNPLIMLALLMASCIVNNVWYRKEWRESKKECDKNKKDKVA